MAVHGQLMVPLAVTHHQGGSYFKPPHDAREGFYSSVGGDLKPQRLGRERMGEVEGGSRVNVMF